MLIGENKNGRCSESIENDTSKSRTYYDESKDVSGRSSKTI
jgi:hypothetical protein